MIISIPCTPPKFKMFHLKVGGKRVDVFPFPMGRFQVPAISFQGCDTLEDILNPMGIGSSSFFQQFTLLTTHRRWGHSLNRMLSNISK